MASTVLSTNGAEVFLGAPASGWLKCQELNIIIFFPSLPESYEISREGDFDTGEKSPLFPDGLVAIYKGCDPIHIPITFTVHASDPLCSNGPVTLVDAAKALHAMALPAIPDEGAITSLTVSPIASLANTEASQASQTGNVNQTIGAANNNGATVAGNATNNGAPVYYMPPMVNLMLFESTVDGNASVAQGTGLNMNGFIKSVKVNLRGPWLKAENFNGRLPSSAEYSFTFVFFPSYTSNPSLGYKAATTTGHRVAQYFFGSNAVVSAHGSVLTGPSSATGTAISSGTAATIPNTQQTGLGTIAPLK